MRRVLRGALPRGLRPRLRRLKQGLTAATAGWWDPRVWKSLARAERWRDAHAGERCFILGNGPSLADTDLSRLRGEFTFGLNRIYLMFGDLGFTTTFLVAINRLVVEQCGGEIGALPMPKFISWDCRNLLPFTRDTVFIRRRSGLGFSPDVAAGYWEGSTVTYAALQIAFHMGFTDVVLVGVDHSFTTQGPAHEEVVSTGDDPNHFDPEYFGRGFRWQLPDLETSELAYRLADHHYRLAGRRIVDATVGGKLDVFPKVDFDRITTSSR